MSFTDGEPWIATEKDCNASWGGKKNGVSFGCGLCGHKFIPGDQVRWQYTNDISAASGNPMVCIKCDGTKEEIVNKIISNIQEFKKIKKRLRFFRW